jgi:polyphosphate kinase
VEIPGALARVVVLPSEKKGADVPPPESAQQVEFALLDDIVTLYGTKLFPGYSVEQTMLFRLTRDADFSVDEDAGENFIHAMEEILEKRKVSLPVRLTCNDTSGTLTELFKTALELDDDDVYRSHGVIDPLSLQFAAHGDESLKEQKWKHYAHPDFAGDKDVWDSIKIKDALLHTPYQSYDPVLSLIKSAALDEHVLAIKMTLYRTSGASPIIDALEKAARNGKHVTVFVELKARFNEQQNIVWASRLEQAGVVVVYGIVNLKVHAKALLIIRKEPAGVRRYVHLSTGNYNEETAKTYSDVSVFTVNNEIANDVMLFFNIISGYSALQTMKHLSMSPIGLKEKIIAMIEREIASSTPENPGRIIAKMNSLAHEEIIEALYRASRAGVRIKLNVRGICMLVPGVAGMSDTIEVHSIIDRYLEHARVFYFWNGGAEEMYLSSADWMPRNLDRRVELMFPILEKDIFSRIRKMLDIYFSDTAKSFSLASDGSWRSAASPAKAERAQETLQRLYKAQAKNEDIPTQMFQVRRKG